MAGIPHHVFREARDRGSSHRAPDAGFQERIRHSVHASGAWDSEGQAFQSSVASSYQVNDPLTGRPKVIYETMFFASVANNERIDVTHAGVNSQQDLNWIKGQLLHYLDKVSTQYVHSEDDDGTCTKDLVSRVLCDVIQRTEQLFRESEGEVTNPAKEMEAIDYFCRPRLITKGDELEVLSITKHVSAGRTVFTTLASPIILAGVGLMAPSWWAMGGSVQKQARCLLRRSLLRCLEQPLRYRLDSGYSIYDGHLQIASVVQSATAGLRSAVSIYHVVGT